MTFVFLVLVCNLLFCTVLKSLSVFCNFCSITVDEFLPPHKHVLQFIFHAAFHLHHSHICVSITTLFISSHHWPTFNSFTYFTCHPITFTTYTNSTRSLHYSSSLLNSKALSWCWLTSFMQWWLSRPTEFLANSVHIHCLPLLCLDTSFCHIDTFRPPHPATFKGSL